eukprot:m.433802 g.433802  ORF g.433802 m.433802 type:complete len:225 (+) comp56757_c0_seq100:2298-2972(+)
MTKSSAHWWHPSMESVFRGPTILWRAPMCQPSARAPDSLRQEMALPLNSHGLGLTNLESMAEISFLSSVCSMIQTTKKFTSLDDDLLQSFVDTGSKATSFARSIEAARAAVDKLLRRAQDFQSCATTARYDLKTKEIKYVRKTKPQWIATTIPTAKSLLTFQKPAKMQRHLTTPKALLDVQNVKRLIPQDVNAQSQFLSKGGFGASAWLRAIPANPGSASIQPC